MGNRIYRRSAVLSVGGFDERLVRLEDREMIWKLEKAGFKTIQDDTITATHLETTNPFGILRSWSRAISYGYWWHMLFYISPDRVGIIAFPIRSLFLLLILFLGLPLSLVIFLLIVLLMVPALIKIWKNRMNVRFCINTLNKSIDKILVIPFFIVKFSLLTFASEMGRWLGLLDKIRGKQSLRFY